MRHRYAFYLPLLAALAAPSAALAQSENGAIAQSLFDQAKALMATGHVAEACPKLEESQRLEPRSGTLINLASCYEQAGRLASAWSRYLEAATAAKNSGNSERESVARERAAALATRLPKLMIEVAPEIESLPGLEIRRDGMLVGKPTWGLALPSDPGEHEVIATALEREPFRAKVSIDGEGQTATVKVVGMATLKPAPSPTAAVTPAKRDETASSRSAARHSLGTARVAALVAGSIGVVGLGVGTGFAIASKAQHDEAGKYCVGSACTDARGVTAGDAAQRDGTVATILLIVGGVGVATGVTLWFTAAHQPNELPTTQVGLGPGRVQLRGTF